MAKFKLDEIDHQILDMLIQNTRVPFTDIAKKLLISAGTVHVRVKKMEDAGIIKGSSLTLDYKKLGYSFIAYVGVSISKSFCPICTIASAILASPCGWYCMVCPTILATLL